MGLLVILDFMRREKYVAWLPLKRNIFLCFYALHKISGGIPLRFEAHINFGLGRYESVHLKVIQITRFIDPTMSSVDVEYAFPCPFSAVHWYVPASLLPGETNRRFPFRELSL